MRRSGRFGGGVCGVPAGQSSGEPMDIENDQRLDGLTNVSRIPLGGCVDESKASKSGLEFWRFYGMVVDGSLSLVKENRLVKGDRRGPFDAMVPGVGVGLALVHQTNELGAEPGVCRQNRGERPGGWPGIAEMLREELRLDVRRGVCHDRRLD